MPNPRHHATTPAPSAPSHGEMMLRYIFLVVLILLAIVSIGSAFIWDDAGTTDYIIAISAALLANQMPGSTRTLAPTSMRPSPRTYEHIGLACASVSILATLIGSVTATDTTTSSITIPWIIATLALLATICISVAIMVVKGRQHQDTPPPPAS
ncbi:hypothetical protein [Actinomyces sp. ICM47]|uniref:hypothetical protein n=1 Tax=Actinomyces sp. ICM47 TaxID=936548 RepID=UPI0012EA0301|nr:hypothetical protein [Actinomyces sp. ICM47]